MSPLPPPTLEDSLREMFPEEWLRQTAKETGLIVRERKIDPVVIFWVLTLGFGVRCKRTLASLKREYEKESNKTLSDSNWYYRFTPELVEFLHQCVIHGIEELAKEPGRKPSKKLENFQDVLIQNSNLISYTFLLIALSFIFYSSQDGETFTDPLIRHLYLYRKCRRFRRDSILYERIL